MLDPNLVKRMRRAAHTYDDDSFFAVQMKDHWFVFNWNLGLAFYDREMMLHCPHFDGLVERVDKIFKDPKKQKEQEVLRILIDEQNWLDLFAGRAGIYLSMTEVDMKVDEECLFSDDHPMMAWQSDGGRRYYMKSDYFAIAEDAVGEDMTVDIYRPMGGATSPPGYRTFIFQDGNSRLRGLLLSAQVHASEDHRRRRRRPRAHVR